MQKLWATYKMEKLLIKKYFGIIFAIILGAIGGLALVSYLEYKYRRCYFCGELINGKTK